MRGRGMLAVTALAASGLLVQPVVADPELDESCLLVEDDLYDTTYQNDPNTTGVLVQPDVDIVSADIGSDVNSVSAVIRLQGMEGYAVTALRHGVTRYRVEFTADKRRYFVELPVTHGVTALARYTTPLRATGGRVGGRTFAISGAVVPSRGEVRFEASRKIFGATAFEPGNLVTRITVTAVRTYADQGQLAPGVSSRVTVGDTATTRDHYVAGTPTCIEPLFTPPPPPPPTEEPSPTPTAEPTEEPTPSPTPSAEPTEEPTEWPSPTDEPTEEPSPEPDPTEPPVEPTGEPTEEPSPAPTPEPTP